MATCVWLSLVASGSTVWLPNTDLNCCDTLAEALTPRRCGTNCALPLADSACRMVLASVSLAWTTPVAEFTVSGEWAFGRYTYTASDSIIIRDPETEGGGTANDSGWGFVVYHHDGDGTWRVARDAWGSDRPAR